MEEHGRAIDPFDVDRPYCMGGAMNLDKEMKDELKELVKLIKMDEKYSALIFDGFLPIDQQSKKYHDDRKVRIYEILSKYGID